jgi:hypothetical protein
LNPKTDKINNTKNKNWLKPLLWLRITRYKPLILYSKKPTLRIKMAFNPRDENLNVFDSSLSS